MEAAGGLSLATTFKFVDANNTNADVADDACGSPGQPALPTLPPVTAREVTSRRVPRASGDAMCCDEH